MLRGMEEKGLLRSTEKRDGRRFWREYRATTGGRLAKPAAAVRLALHNRVMNAMHPGVTMTLFSTRSNAIGKRQLQ